MTTPTGRIIDFMTVSSIKLEITLRDLLQHSLRLYKHRGHQNCIKAIFQSLRHVVNDTPGITHVVISLPQVSQPTCTSVFVNHVCTGTIVDNLGHTTIVCTDHELPGPRHLPHAGKVLGRSLYSALPIYHPQLSPLPGFCNFFGCRAS